MHARDRGGERKSESGARPRTRPFQPDKPGEDPGSVRWRNPRTPVGDREHDGSAGPPRRYADVRLRVANALLGRAVFERVVDEIGDRLAYQRAVATDPETIVDADSQLHALFFGDRFVELGDAPGRLAHVEWLKRPQIATCFCACDQQEGVEDPDE